MRRLTLDSSRVGRERGQQGSGFVSHALALGAVAKEFKDGSDVAALHGGVALCVFDVGADELNNGELHLLVEASKAVINAEEVVDGARHGAVDEHNEGVSAACGI